MLVLRDSLPPVKPNVDPAWKNTTSALAEE
jgi:hypothetical protein